LKEANIQSATLGEAKGLTIEQIKAAQNWKKAVYSAQLIVALGLSNAKDNNSGAAD